MSANHPIPADRPNSALLVVDVQTQVMDLSINSDQVVSTVSDLVDRARDNGSPVIWVRHSSAELPLGSPKWQIVDALVPRDGEAIVEKTHGDSFESTDLEEVLVRLDVGHLIVVGAQTDACVRATIHGGFVRGYHVTLVSDAHTTEDLSEWGAPSPAEAISHANLYWQFQSGPGRKAVVAPAAEIDFSVPANPDTMKA